VRRLQREFVASTYKGPVAFSHQCPISQTKLMKASCIETLAVLNKLFSFSEGSLSNYQVSAARLQPLPPH
jgi:hypothetical protein